jgi:RimJ/RimL family protein N-acetyltransferase
MNEASGIPLDGPVVDGEWIMLGWPEPVEYDRITALRNRPTVRSCFLDPRPLDVEANRAWLAHGMQRPSEGLLSIRLGGAQAFCGTIGWSGYEPERRTFEIGRLIVDAVTVARHRSDFPRDYPGVAIDASTALLRFAFETMDFDQVTSRFLSDLALPRRVNVLAGGVRTGETELERPDGSRVKVTNFVLTRERWRALRSECANGAGMGAASRIVAGAA